MPETRTSPASKKIKLVISDCHLSRGKWLPDGRRNPLEDFHQDLKLREMLEYYTSGAYAETEVELVVNGDFFDPLAIIPLPPTGRLRNLEFPIEIEEDSAVRQFQKIIEGHPVVFQAMRDFLKKGQKIILRWGNHDAAMLWPKVQDLLRETLTAPSPEQLEFQQKPYIFDRICIDHGHQYEALNRFDEENIFITRKTKHGLRRIQNLPFGSFFVLGFINRLKLERSYINQVYPFRIFLKVSFFTEPIFFFSNGFKVLWFFIKMRFITHPMRFARFRKTLDLIGEIFHRPSLEEAAEKLFTGSGSENLAFDTLILGHNHQATFRVFPGGKQYINTGTWIPITSLEMNTLGHRVLRTYALIEYFDGKPRTSLKVWQGQPHVSEDFA
ncbi:metallophosphoesterase [bacterium]|nr:metallophosphoesterase [bacterium]